MLGTFGEAKLREVTASLGDRQKVIVAHAASPRIFEFHHFDIHSTGQW